MRSLLSDRYRRSWMTDAGCQMEAHILLDGMVVDNTRTRKHEEMRNGKNDLGELLEYQVGDNSWESGK